MQHHRTHAYWSARILLVVGILGVAAVAGLVLVGATARPCFGCDDTDVLGLRASVIVAVAAVGLALAGLGWTIRIFRGERHHPPAWRYRDR